MTNGNNPELDALLGAYALDALDPAERAQVEAYIATNPQARNEVDELRESAASLALAPAVDDVAAPPELWDRIASSITEREPVPEAPVSLAEQRAKRRARPIVAVLSVAAAIAIVALGVRVVQLNSDLNDANQSAFSKASSQAGAKQVALAPSQGSEVARIVLLPDGNGVLKNDGMKPLGPDQTYQLWALTGDPNHPTAISAGVLGADPKGAAFRTTPDAHGFALTIEHAPGVVSSTQAPYASATIS